MLHYIVWITYLWYTICMTTQLPKLKWGMVLVGHAGDTTARILPTNDNYYWHIAINGPFFASATHKPIGGNMVWRVLGYMGFNIGGAFWSYDKCDSYTYNPYALVFSVVDLISPSRVYFIQSADSKQIKIGRSTNIKKRMKAMQIGSSAKLKLLGTIPGSSGTETIIHNKFRHLRQTGEWHLPGDDLVKFIKDANTAIQTS